MRFQAPRGTEDVLPSVSHTWQRLESIFHSVAQSHGYSEIRTPVFEDSQLFKRTAGEGSDIVSKEMYEFQDKGGRDIALKPEGTAPAIRAVLEHSLCPPGTHSRLYYLTSCYRYSRPTRGRLRELHQFGCELLGSSSPEADAEIIEVAYRFLEELGLTGLKFTINSIGNAECRQKYSAAILEHVGEFLTGASEEVRQRIIGNPMGMLDSKDPVQQSALEGLPVITDYLEPESAARFEHLKQLLTEAGVPFVCSARTVRGLDYYNETVFELESELVPGMSLLGGGRYDNLVSQLGGAQTPCVGFGIGVERVLLALEAAALVPERAGPVAFVVRSGENSGELTREVLRKLRSKQICSETDIDARSLKSQLRQADKSGASYAIIIGDDEVLSRELSVKNLKTGEQIKVKLCDICDMFLQL